MRWLIMSAAACALISLSVPAMAQERSTPRVQTAQWDSSAPVEVQTVRHQRDGRYRWHNGHWWYWHPNSYWMYHDGYGWHRHGYYPSYRYYRPYPYYRYRYDDNWRRRRGSDFDIDIGRRGGIRFRF